MVMDADHESAEHSLLPSEAFVNQVDLLTPAEEPGSSSSLSSSSTGSSLSASFFRLDESKSHEDDRSVTSLSLSSELPPKQRADPSTSESLPSLSGWEEHTTEAGQSFQFQSPRALSEPVQPNSEGFFQDTSGSPQKLNEVHSGKETTPKSPGSVSTPTSVQAESVLQSPPVQVMERPEITSTYRIPSHVFERSSTNPAEWSVASNESLFSIQVGNSSFSRDNTFRLGKSGEIFSPNTPEGMGYYKSPLAPIPAADSENRVSGLEEDLGLLDAAAPGTTKDTDGAKEDQNKPRVQIVEATRSPPRHISQGSGTSPHAFGNPLNKRKKRKKCCGWLCCCFKCCQPCSKCAWPSCSCSNCSPDCCNFTCPSCSCSKHGSTCCSCSNCTPKCCHCGWPSCSCSKCFKGCCHCSCSSCCKPCSCCAWPSCSSCFSCRKCCRCKWPSCNCCCPCSSCKWPSCPCSSCSLMCCKWPWTSCSKSCKSCQFKSPPCCLPNCSGCCCHCTGVSCYRCKCSCTVCIYEV